MNLHAITRWPRRCGSGDGRSCLRPRGAVRYLIFSFCFLAVTAAQRGEAETAVQQRQQQQQHWEQLSPGGCMASVDVPRGQPRDPADRERRRRYCSTFHADGGAAHPDLHHGWRRDRPDTLVGRWHPRRGGHWWPTLLLLPALLFVAVVCCRSWMGNGAMPSARSRVPGADWSWHDCPCGYGATAPMKHGTEDLGGSQGRGRRYKFARPEWTCRRRRKTTRLREWQLSGVCGASARARVRHLDGQALGRRLPPVRVRSRVLRARMRAHKWLEGEPWRCYLLEGSLSRRELRADADWAASDGLRDVHIPGMGHLEGARDRRTSALPAVRHGGTSPRNIRSFGRRATAAVLVAALLTLRIGEADHPGPWPIDAIRLKTGGWTVAGGDHAGCEDWPARAPRHGGSPFDDPEDFSLGPDDDPTVNCTDCDMGIGSTAPPSEDGDADGPSPEASVLGDDAMLLGECGGAHDDEGPMRHDDCIFFPSATFDGPWRGYCFKTGQYGLGYYVDHGGVADCKRQNGTTRPRSGGLIISLCDAIPMRGGEQGDAAVDGGGVDEAPTEPMTAEQERTAARPARARGKRRRPGANGAAFPLPCECTRADPSHRDFGVWAIDTINPNAWIGAADHARLSSADVILAQETRKRGARRLDAERGARAMRWRFSMCNAKHTEAGRLSAGAAVGVRSHMGMSGGEDLYTGMPGSDTGFRYTRKWIGAICRGGLHCGSVYLRAAEGASDANLDILQDIAIDLSSLNGPWVLGGDWNLAPEELAASGWLALVDGAVIAPATPTCNGKVYDYFVVSNRFKQAVIGAAAISDAQHNPHTAVRLFVSAAPRALVSRSLVAPRKIGANLPAGCLTADAAAAATRCASDGGAPSPWVARARRSQAGGTDGTVTQQQHPHSPHDADGEDPPRNGSSRSKWARWIAEAERDLAEIAGLAGEEARKFGGRADGPRFRTTCAIGRTADVNAGTGAATREWRAVAIWTNEMKAAATATLEHGQPTRGVAIAAAAARRRLGALVARHRRWEQGVESADGGDAGTGEINAMRQKQPRPFDDHGFDAGPRHAAMQACRNAHDPVALEQIAAVATSRAEACERKSRSRNAAEWKAWITGGAGGGLRRQHRFIKALHGWVPSRAASQPALIFSSLDDASSLTPAERRRLRSAEAGAVEPLTTQQEVDNEARRWAELWAVGQSTERLRWPRDLGPMPPRPSVEQLRAALATFPTETGLAWDALHPRSLSRLADARLEGFIDLLMEAESEGRWPPEVAFVSVVLLGKPDGGFRPIGLFPCLVRVWMRLRRGMIAQWEQEHDKPYLLAGAGRGADTAAWKQAARAECAAGAGASYAQLLLDLEKAFELVDHRVLIDEAIAVGFPLPLLRLSLAAYRLPRALAIEGTYSSLIDPLRGITAGSGMATAELKVLLYRLLAAVAKKYPQLTLSAYVDDVSAEAVGSAKAVSDVIVGAGLELCEGMCKLGLRLSRSGKCNCTATTDAIGNNIADRMKAFGVVFMRRVKSLGVGLGAGKRRHAAVQKTRLGKFVQKLRRIIALACSGVSAVKLLRTGAAAVMTYGDDTIGVADSALLQRRRAVAAALNKHGKGKELDLVLAMAENTTGSSVDPAFAAHTAPLVRWAEAIWGGWVPVATLSRAVARAKGKLSGARSPWNAVAGPAAAAVATAARLGWVFDGADIIITDSGRRLDLAVDPPIIVKSEVIAAVRRWRWGRIVDRHPILRGGGADGDKSLDPLRRLLQPKARRAGWGAAQQAALKSAITNGQWLQTRLHAAGLVDDPACQFCAQTSAHPGVAAPIGSAAHRVLDCAVVAAVARGALGHAWSQFRATRRRARRQLGRFGHDGGDDPQALVGGGRQHLPTADCMADTRSEQAAAAAAEASLTTQPNLVVTARACGLRADADDPHDDHAEPTSGDGRRDGGAIFGRRTAWLRGLHAGHGLGKAQAAEVIRSATRRAWDRMANMLAWTRGLTTRPVQSNAHNVGDDGTFEWVTQPRDDQTPVVFYTDGSVLDQSLGSARTVAWAFTAVDSHGVTVAEAHGIAPAWVGCINGAEAWAIKQAAMLALPGARFVTDSLTCLNALRNGPRRALHPKNRLARVWRQIFTIFDTESDSASLRWMPSHCTEQQIGEKKCSDGAPVTRADWLGNARADALAKQAAFRRRAPLDYRAEVAACDDAVETIGMYLGWFTWAANNAPGPPFRDATSLTAAQRAEATRRRAAGGAERPRRAVVRHTRSPLLGGHALLFRAGWWECAVCWKRSRTRSQLAPEKCSGSVVRRWAALEANATAATGEAGRGNGRRHVRWMTDDVVWCCVCGSYAEQKARGLAAQCKGPPPASGGGRTTSLARLRRGRHPKTNEALRGLPTPEPGMADLTWHADFPHWHWGRRRHGGVVNGLRDRPAGDADGWDGDACRHSGDTYATQPSTTPAAQRIAAIRARLLQRLSGDSQPAPPCQIEPPADAIDDVHSGGNGGDSAEPPAAERRCPHGAVCDGLDGHGDAGANARDISREVDPYRRAGDGSRNNSGGSSNSSSSSSTPEVPTVASDNCVVDGAKRRRLTAACGRSTDSHVHHDVRAGAESDDEAVLARDASCAPLHGCTADEQPCPRPAKRVKWDLAPRATSQETTSLVIATTASSSASVPMLIQATTAAARLAALRDRVRLRERLTSGPAALPLPIAKHVGIGDSCTSLTQDAAAASSPQRKRHCPAAAWAARGDTGCDGRQPSAAARQAHHQPRDATDQDRQGRGHCEMAPGNLPLDADRRDEGLQAGGGSPTDGVASHGGEDGWRQPASRAPTPTASPQATLTQAMGVATGHGVEPSAASSGAATSAVVDAPATPTLADATHDGDSSAPPPSTRGRARTTLPLEPDPRHERTVQRRRLV